MHGIVPLTPDVLHQFMATDPRKKRNSYAYLIQHYRPPKFPKRKRHRKRKTNKVKSQNVILESRRRTK